MFDLNWELSGAYLEWQQKNLPNCQVAVSELHLDAFLEGAKTYQRFMREAMDGLDKEIDE